MNRGERILKLSEEMREKTNRLAELVEELDGSLRIKAFFPEAFEHGAIKSCIYGGGTYSMKYRITRGDGSVFEWPLKDVPRDIIDRYLARLSDPPLLNRIKHALRQIDKGVLR